MPGSDLISEPSYPALRFIARHGYALAAVAGLGVAAFGLCMWLAGSPWWIPVFAVLAGGLVVLLIRSYCDLVRLIVDILLPP